MGAVGLTMAAATLAALVIVVTAAFGFTTVPSLRLPQPLGARPTLTAHRGDRHSFASLTRIPSDEKRGADSASDRHTHV